MKYIFTILFINLNILAFSQACVSDTSIKKAGFYPKVLDTAHTGQLYQEIINFKVLADTNVVFGGFPVKAIVDSAHVIKVLGTPNGFTYAFNKTRPVYTPLEVGCVKFQGTPSVSGEYPLKIIIFIYAKVSGFPVTQADTIKSFKLVVEGTSLQHKTLKNDILIYPNPSHSIFNINSTGDIQNVAIYNVLGERMEYVSLNQNRQIDISNLQKGIYTLVFYNQGQYIYKQIIKQ